MHGTLYTFAKQLYDCQLPCGVGLVKVVRLQDAATEDWHVWPDRYCEQHPNLRLLEIATIEVVDERSMIEV